MSGTRFRLSTLLAPALASAPEATAVVAGDEVVSYAELDDVVGRVAAALTDAGVAPQDRVVFVGKNSVEQIAVILGAARLNAVAVSINPRLQPAELAFVINDTLATVAVVDDDRLDAVRDATSSIERISTVVLVGSPAQAGVPTFDEWIAARRPVPSRRVDPAPTDAALQIYTSGTTGHPKGVVLSQAAVTETLPGLAELWKLTPDSVMLTVLPWFHIAGVGAVLITLGGGGTVVLNNESAPAVLMALVERHRVTNLVLASVILQWIVESAAVESTDLSSLRVVSYGASPITQQTLQRATALLSCDLLQVYGLTETMGTVAALSADDHRRALPGTPSAELLLSCGRPVAGVEVRLVDPDTGEDVADGVAGEVWARSPRNMSGYWRAEEATTAALTPDGWLRTGDLARRDAAGYLYLCDRLKDMIVTGGENVFPSEVESALQWHPDVAEVAVIGVPHDRWGETPKALVVAQPDTALTAAALIAFARQRLAHFKCPTSVDFVDTLPKTPSGKVLKRALRAEYWDGFQPITKATP